MNLQDQKIVIPNGNEYNFIKLGDIIRIEAEGSYAMFYLATNEKFISCKGIGYYVDSLSSYGFYCTHKSHLINTEHVKSYKRDGTLLMDDGSLVPVSRRKKEDFFSKVINVVEPKYYNLSSNNEQLVSMRVSNDNRLFRTTAMS